MAKLNFIDKKLYYNMHYNEGLFINIKMVLHTLFRQGLIEKGLATERFKREMDN